MERDMKSQHLRFYSLNERIFKTLKRCIFFLISYQDIREHFYIYIFNKSKMVNNLFLQTPPRNLKTFHFKIFYVFWQFLGIDSEENLKMSISNVKKLKNIIH